MMEATHREVNNHPIQQQEAEEVVELLVGVAPTRVCRLGRTSGEEQSDLYLRVGLHKQRRAPSHNSPQVRLWVGSKEARGGRGVGVSMEARPVLGRQVHRE